MRISVFAFDPDNPSFEPKIRLNPNHPATSADGSTVQTPASVSYQVTGLPQGASFDPDTLEILWTPGYTQAGTYSVTVTATDDGDGSATPAVSQVTLPIVVSNANIAPVIGDISNAFVAKGAVLEIPITAVDPDGNPLSVTIFGLPEFASYTQNPPNANGVVTGTIRFAPGANSRGDYTLTVVAQDNGDGNINQVLTQAKSFVVTVTSISEAPVISAPSQVVAVAGQELSVAINVRDLDQDALSYSAAGLPQGATLSALTQYGQAILSWTPSADAIGVHDIELTVTDSGLGPQDAGHPPGTATQKNVSTRPIRIVVRSANAAPELKEVQVNGVAVADSGAGTLKLTATEGAPLQIDLLGNDANADLINWSSLDLPRGMRMQIGENNRASLLWTPDLFAAQDSVSTGTAGLWRFTVKGSDGMAEVSKTIEIQVANFNQTPRILPMPLQLVSEGETVSFTLRAGDADNEVVRTSLVYDENTPAGILFDPNTGYFEWTPSQDVVNNAAQDNQAFTLTFRATDGLASSTQTVQVRVFDVNRTPRLNVANRVVLVGENLSIPVQKGGSDSHGAIVIRDDDGSAQTQALSVSFSGLPEGASFDGQNLNWTPGPGQIGDYVISAQISDGRNTTTKTFTVRSIADAAANAPKISVSSTPSTPALPGQLIVVTVRADAYSPISSVRVEARGAALGDAEQWQNIEVDSAGRAKFTPSAPGLIELRVTARDQDGFVGTQTHTVRVKDPIDTAAPSIDLERSTCHRHRLHCAFDDQQQHRCAHASAREAIDGLQTGNR